MQGPSRGATRGTPGEGETMAPSIRAVHAQHPSNRHATIAWLTLIVSHSTALGTSMPIATPIVGRSSPVETNTGSWDLKRLQLEGNEGGPVGQRQIL